MNHTKLILVGLAVLLSAAASHAQVAATAPAGFTVGRETTYVNGPLNADGTIDYVAALNERLGKGVTAERNAAILLVRLAPDSPASRELLARLGVEADGPRLTPFFEYLRRTHPRMSRKEQSKALDDCEAAYSSPWTAAKYPLVAQWLAGADGAVDGLASATKRPDFFLPIAAGNPPDVGLFQACRDFARILSARAMLRLGSGQTAAALDDAAAIHRMARLLSRRSAILDWMTAGAIEQLACLCDEQIALSGALDAKQAAAHLAALEAMGPLAPPSAAIDVGGRYDSLAAVMQWIRGGVSVAARLPQPMKLDWDVVLRTVNQLHSDAAAAVAADTHEVRRQKIAALSEAVRDELRKAKMVDDPDVERLTADFDALPADERGRRSRLLTLFHAVPSLDVWSKLPDGIASVQAQQALSRLAVALAAWRADTGEYPAELSKLEKYLKPLPPDPFTGKPLVYKPVGKGYLLYSVGPNLKDDGGKDFAQDGDDIVVKADK